MGFLPMERLSRSIKGMVILSTYYALLIRPMQAKCLNMIYAAKLSMAFKKLEPSFVSNQPRTKQLMTTVAPNTV